MGASILKKVLLKLNLLLAQTPLVEFPFYHRIKEKFLTMAIKICPRSFITAISDGVFVYAIGPYGTLNNEPYTTQLFKQALNPGAIVLDIGHIVAITL